MDPRNFLAKNICVRARYTPRLLYKVLCADAVEKRIKPASAGTAWIARLRQAMPQLRSGFYLYGLLISTKRWLAPAGRETEPLCLVYHPPCDRGSRELRVWPGTVASSRKNCLETLTINLTLTDYFPALCLLLRTPICAQPANGSGNRFQSPLTGLMGK